METAVFPGKTQTAVLASRSERRGAERIGMRIDVSGGRARIEVSDLEARLRAAGEPESPDLLGLSLYLVDHLVDRWGVVPMPGPVLWAEIDLPSPR